MCKCVGSKISLIQNTLGPVLSKGKNLINLIPTLWSVSDRDLSRYKLKYDFVTKCILNTCNYVCGYIKISCYQWTNNINIKYKATILNEWAIFTDWLVMKKSIKLVVCTLGEIAIRMTLGLVFNF